ncbi:hypothetical protein ACU5AX_03055 [Sphingomonas sp. XXL09]|uniref:hypothetical protein n=1 Tax=Sphingomonas sp. XXL09 TaxID=3457787 RepID=UPI00406BB365
MTEPHAGEPTPSGPMPTLFEAIVRMRAITATYNRGAVLLAPHILFTRHGEIYLDAVTLERDGKPPREEKMGTFKLDGLGAPTIVEDRPFFPSTLYDPAQEKYAGLTLLAVERA